jgi:MFS family permease
MYHQNEHRCQLFQILVLLSVSLTETMIMFSLIPPTSNRYGGESILLLFTRNKLSLDHAVVSELPFVGGDQRKVGYYIGIIVRLLTSDISQVPIAGHAFQLSVNYLAETVTVLQWNRLSVHIGRKPILLSGFLGTTVSITLFGLSRSFWTLALWCVFA